jgi:hypothetical protein
VLTTTGIEALTLVLLVLPRDLLLAYAGVLLAVLLRTPSDWVSERTGVPPRLALATALLMLVQLLYVEDTRGDPVEVQSLEDDVSEGTAPPDVS